MIKVICKGLRPTTNSTLTVEIPRDVWMKDIETLEDPKKCDYHSIEWFGNEFDWNFIPMVFIMQPLVV